MREWAKWASEWAQQSGQATQAGLSKRISEWCEQTSEWSGFLIILAHSALPPPPPSAPPAPPVALSHWSWPFWPPPIPWPLPSTDHHRTLPSWWSFQMRPHIQEGVSSVIQAWVDFKKKDFRVKFWRNRYARSSSKRLRCPNIFRLVSTNTATFISPKQLPRLHLLPP